MRPKPDQPEGLAARARTTRRAAPTASTGRSPTPVGRLHKLLIKREDQQDRVLGDANRGAFWREAHVEFCCAAGCRSIRS